MSNNHITSIATYNPWMNINCNQIEAKILDIGELKTDSIETKNLVINETKSSTINATVASGVAFLDMKGLSTGSDNEQVGVTIGNAQGDKLYLISKNAPSSNQIIKADNQMQLTTNAGSIILRPNATNALTCSLISPGVTYTSIQNLLLPTTGGTPSPLNYYEELTLPVTYSGPWAVSQNRDIKITRIGRIVTLLFESVLQVATVNINITVTGTIPARFRPQSTADSNETWYSIPITDNTIVSTVFMSILNTGAITITHVYSGAGSSGFNNLSISYSV